MTPAPQPMLTAHLITKKPAAKAKALVRGAGRASVSARKEILFVSAD